MNVTKGEMMTVSQESVAGKKRIRELGMEPARLFQLKNAVQQDIDKSLYDGAVLLVARHGEIVLKEAMGLSDKSLGRQAKTNDIFYIVSLTKQFVSIRILMDIEKGKFTLTTPIKDVIPEFGIKGKQRITIGHILSHTSGLNSEVPFSLSPDKLTDIEAVTATLCNERLLYQPGTIVSYNALTAHSILAAMITRLDEQGRSFRGILKEDLFNPLGMKDAALGLPPDLKPRVVPMKVRDKTPGMFDPVLIESINFLLNEASEFPAGGGISSAMDIYRFAEMLRNRGELNGNRVLSPESVALATINHTGSLTNHLMDYMREMYGWPIFPAYLGLSFFLRGNGIFPTFLGLSASSGTFGGMGAGSTVFWVDPERDLTYVFLSAGLMEEGASIMRHQRLSDMAIASVVD